MELGPFKVGDRPANPITVDIDGEDLTIYTTATAILSDGDGLPVATLGVVPVTDEQVTFPFPADPFETAGLYHLTIVLAGVAASLELDPIPVVVETVDGWHTLNSARLAWADAPVDNAELWQLLAVSRLECEAFAPAYVGRAPINYRQAQLLQARSRWQAGLSNPQDQIGADGYAITVYPLDRTIRQILRPKRGVPSIG